MVIKVLLCLCEILLAYYVISCLELLIMNLFLQFKFDYLLPTHPSQVCTIYKQVLQFVYVYIPILCFSRQQQSWVQINSWTHETKQTLLSTDFIFLYKRIQDRNSIACTTVQQRSHDFHAELAYVPGISYLLYS